MRVYLEKSKLISYEYQSGFEAHLYSYLCSTRHWSWRSVANKIRREESSLPAYSSAAEGAVATHKTSLKSEIMRRSVIGEEHMQVADGHKCASPGSHQPSWDFPYQLAFLSNHHSGLRHPWKKGTGDCDT